MQSQYQNDRKHVCSPANVGLVAIEVIYLGFNESVENGRQ